MAIVLARLHPEAAAALSALEATATTDGWSAAHFYDSLAAGCRAVAAEINGQCVGAIFSQHVADEVEILNLFVGNAWQRQGIASALLADLIDSCRMTAQRLLLDVRRSNRAALALYQRFGFTTYAIRRRYYRSQSADGSREDALQMVLSLTQTGQ